MIATKRQISANELKSSSLKKTKTNLTINSLFFHSEEFEIEHPPTCLTDEVLNRNVNPVDYT